MDIILNRLAGRFSALAAAILLCASVFAQDAGNYYRSRQIGDKAFGDGYYSLAVKFYTQYRNEAADDPSALKDAYFCLFSAYARSRDAKSARSEFNQFTVKFAGDIVTDKNFAYKAEYWNASILVIEGETDRAIEAFNQILKNAPDISDVYAESLSALGAVWAGKLNWDEADKAYAKLESIGKDTKWADYARKQRITVAIYRGDFEKAKAMLDAGDAKSVTNILLSAFLLVKDGKLAEAENIYRKIKAQAKGPDSLWFAVSSAIADAYSGRNELKASIPYLKDAEYFAENDTDRQRITLQLINAQALPKSYDEAIDSCQKFIRNFPDSPNLSKVKLQMARMCFPLKKQQMAVSIYKDMLSDPKIDSATKLAAAKEAGQVFISEKLYNEATDSMTNLKEILQKVNRGEGTVGKIVNDQELYKNAKMTLQKLDKATEGLEDQGPLSVMGILVNNLF